ncbi:MAG TPA: hypothetical protein VFV67_05950 [Actinophytocola sp.]|uniref:hypothetical protein n=1 Tax=Actinophytocola sp. TaxID=1872138 RepID=UPI002DB63A17|nr:hypothetical protein [Actinophytocola sp.]HEU5470177.1 hypothetical protein [Actinophytocola sp.]
MGNQTYDRQWEIVVQLRTRVRGRRAVTRVLAALLSVAAIVLAPAPAVASHTSSTAADPCGGEQWPGVPGTRVKSPNSARVYLVDPNGYRRWIVSGYYFDLFGSWNGIEVDPYLQCMLQGPDLKTFDLDNPLVMDRGSYLAKEIDDPAVYLLDGDQARWITTPQVFDKYHFDARKIVIFADTELSRHYYLGPNWT